MDPVLKTLLLLVACAEKAANVVAPVIARAETIDIALIAILRFIILIFTPFLSEYELQIRKKTYLKPLTSYFLFHNSKKNPSHILVVTRAHKRVSKRTI